MADQAFLPKLFDLFSSVLRENDPLPETSSQVDSEKHEATCVSSIEREHELSPSEKNQLVWTSKLSKTGYNDEKNLFDKHRQCDSNSSKKREKFSYSSLTIPCRLFRATDRLYNMKVNKIWLLINISNTCINYLS